MRGVRRLMRNFLTFLLLLVSTEISLAGDTDKLIVTFDSRDTKTYQVFSLPRSEVKKLPLWIPGSTEPPLSVGEAVETSKKWLDKDNKALQLETVYLAKKSSAGISDVWFYNLFYSNSPVNLSDPLEGQTIIILMDGRVLESETMTEKEFENLLMRQ